MNIRLATLDDISQIECLIELSFRKLSINDYSKEQIDGALKADLGLDIQLISDKTYMVVESEGEIIACGGWSYRAPLLGSDLEANRNSTIVNIEHGAAKIRVFFVHPKFSRMGLGSLIMDHCEIAAKERGYKRLELMATPLGKKLYERHGFMPSIPEEFPLNEQLTIAFVPTDKVLC